ncbi:MAG: hypothetical protein EXR28_07120 [Betaproteobacteria bacterium]|nr:hypothetical protein [Betaproteobacteria bacterium]
MATFEDDQYKQCRSSAILDAMRQMPFPGIHPFPIVGRDRLGRAFVVYPSWWHTDQLIQEHMNMNHCMSRLGFKLVPIATHSQPRATGSGMATEPKTP